MVADAEPLTDLRLDVWEEAYDGLVPAHVLAARRREREARVVRWRQRIETDAAGLRVAEQDGRMVGFAQSGPGRDRGDHDLPDMELMALYVRAGYYGSGIGYALFDAVIGRSPAYLWVLDGNTRAIEFYRSQGFGLDGRVKTEAVGDGPILGASSLIGLRVDPSPRGRSMGQGPSTGRVVAAVIHRAEERPCSGRY